NRVADLLRIASNGTGILRDGALPTDLVGRLASEAAKSARHVLQMCIRALDYTPPIDLTFGEYLRALLTADYELVPDDDLGYRIPVVDAFRDWGIIPDDVRSWSVESLVWQRPDVELPHGLDALLAEMKVERWNLSVNRRAQFLLMEQNKAILHEWL